MPLDDTRAAIREQDIHAMSEDDTLPPRKPNTLRTWLPRIWAWCVANRDYSIPFAAFVLGAVLGKVV